MQIVILTATIMTKNNNHHTMSYDKSSYVKHSYGDKYRDHKDKVKKYECKKGHLKEGIYVSFVEFCKYTKRILNFKNKYIER